MQEVADSLQALVRAISYHANRAEGITDYSVGYRDALRVIGAYVEDVQVSWKEYVRRNG